jgi:hypothetical protein
MNIRENMQKNGQKFGGKIIVNIRENMQKNGQKTDVKIIQLLNYCRILDQDYIKHLNLNLLINLDKQWSYVDVQLKNYTTI